MKKENKKRKNRTPLTLEQKENIKDGMDKFAKPVIQLNIYDRTIVAEFRSIHEASRKTGINRKGIRCAAKGEAIQAGYYYWEFAQE